MLFTSTAANFVAMLFQTACRLHAAFGIVSAVFEARNSGKGQVVDAAIVDMVAVLGSIAHFIYAAGQIGGTRPSAFYDSPFYDLFQCADGEWISLAPLEPHFYAQLVERLQLTDVDPKAQYDLAGWPALKDRLTALLRRYPIPPGRHVQDGARERPAGGGRCTLARARRRRPAHCRCLDHADHYRWQYQCTDHHDWSV